jgi:hypothetical protein
MSELVPSAIRERILSIRQDLDRLAGERKSVEITVAASPASDYLLRELPGIDALCRELEAELEMLESESRPQAASPAEPALGVSETEHHLEQLLARIAAADTELTDVRSRLPTLRGAYERMVIHGDGDMSEAFGELEAVRR